MTYIDQGLVAVSGFSVTANITVWVENCVFEYIANNKSLASSIPLIEIELLSIGAMLSFINCTFHSIAWKTTIDINPKLIPFLSTPSIYSSKHNTAQVIKSCTFSSNKNSLTAIRGHEMINNNDFV